jgi:hypothetical protein
VVQLYAQALGSLFVASYNSQGYSGGIRTSVYAGNQQLKFNAKVTSWLAVYRQSVQLGAKTLEDHGQIFLFSTEPLRS